MFLAPYRWPINTMACTHFVRIHQLYPNTASSSCNLVSRVACSTNVNISISFGGTSWAINPVDMNVGTIELQSGSDQMCVGSLYGMASAGSDSMPSWVIGDVFLKNVYSVFQADPPAVGFAQLASGLQNSGEREIFSSVRYSLAFLVC